jgi:hypothetical protein
VKAAVAGTTNQADHHRAIGDREGPQRRRRRPVTCSRR